MKMGSIKVEFVVVGIWGKWKEVMYFIKFF